MPKAPVTAPGSVAVLNHATALIGQGQPAQAAALLRKHLYRNARDGKARRLLASLGPVAKSEPPLSPDQTARRRRVQRQFQAQDWAGILKSAEPLLKTQPVLGDVANALGNALEASGRSNEAMRVFDHALRADPMRPDAYISMSSLLRIKGQATEARAAARAALDVAPQNAAVHVAIGLAEMDLDNLEAAETHLRKAAAINPNEPATWDALCKMLERLNRLDDLDAALTEAEGHLSGEPSLALNRLVWLSRLGKSQDVITAANLLPIAKMSARSQATAHVHHARALHEVGDYGAAFDAYSAMNAAAARFEGRGDISASRYLDRVEAKLAAATALTQQSWTAAKDGQQPVFMVGFPRSGTTLLETILMAHPKTLLAEEVPMVHGLANGIRPTHEADDLAALSADEASKRTKAYWADFKTATGASLDGRIAFDKLPLNLVEAASIHRMFPHSKFIMSLRHPCDVVLSCFMQNFALNDAMDTFRDLEATARLYDKTMCLWQTYRDKLDLNVIEIRYEDLVHDLKGTVTPVLEFCELSWLDQMDRFHESARVVRTASYRQVSQKLYRSAAGRWRNYERQMASVMDPLERWIDQYGYAAEPRDAGQVSQ